ncbi:MAG: RnfABCDGE type electron transport complex subunit D [Clostridiales bacterium]|nr:RnfABCDGE type electron transport complex subunit D [Clostridiales bacterium]
MIELKKVIVTSSPHIRNENDTRSIMIDVIIALLPALALGTFVFGPRALTITTVSVISAVFFEWFYQKLLKKPSTIGDCSAVVTGILLAYNLPVTAPLWLPIIGTGFAVILVKQLYGGIGKNFMNPALAARAFLFSWPVIMTTWVKPHTALPLFVTPVDVVTAATPLAQMKFSQTLPDVTVLEMALGQIGGCLGETSALALLAGGLYLLYRRVITPRIPVAYIGTVAALTYFFPRGNDPFLWMSYSVLGGGLMLGAIFMATDYSSSPVTKTGQWIFGIGCGLITVFIRYFGSYSEGVSYSILVMNATVWIIDKYSKPLKFGYVRKKRGADSK